MIEILPIEAFWSGSYCVQSAVDLKAYLHIYNEIFVEEWNQYIESTKEDHNLLISKVVMEKSKPENSMPFDFLSLSEKLRISEVFKNRIGFRHGKKCMQIKRLVKDFDRVRNIIAYYDNKFYAYTIQTIQTIFDGVIVVYMLDENDITNILNSLYLTLHKRNRILARDNLFKELEHNYEIHEYQ